MKNDYEVKLYMSERRKGLSQKVAAARAGMSERTDRKGEHRVILLVVKPIFESPCQVK